MLAINLAKEAIGWLSAIHKEQQEIKQLLKDISDRLNRIGEF